MWPYICQVVEKLLRETVEPAVKVSDPHLSTFCFSKIDIGDKVSEKTGGRTAERTRARCPSCTWVRNSFHMGVKIERGQPGGADPSLSAGRVWDGRECRCGVDGPA